jgi:hypothetical protein
VEGAVFYILDFSPRKKKSNSHPSFKTAKK